MSSLLPLLPDVCKHHIWSYFTVEDLVNISSTSHGVNIGVNIDFYWRHYSYLILFAETNQPMNMKRIVNKKLKRQNGSRNLHAAIQTLNTSPTTPLPSNINHLNPTVQANSQIWYQWYRTYTKLALTCEELSKSQAIGHKHLRQWKKESHDYEEQAKLENAALKQAKEGRKQFMNCLRWQNRSKRRKTALVNATIADVNAITNRERRAKLLTLAAQIEKQSSLMYELRFKHQQLQQKLKCHIQKGLELMETEVV